MILSVDRLSVNFTTSGGILQAVRDVGFSLDEGEILGIVGESGSGKSVTAHSILRLLPANGEVAAGSILFRDASVLDMDKETLRAFRGRRVAMIFQEPGRSFDPIYSIGKSLAETLRAHRPELDEEAVRKRSIELLEEVHVTHPADRLGNFPHQFSGGLLQRIMIAHALASDPEVLIADEPTTALDVTIQAGIINLLLELRSRRNLAIVFITHNLALISSFADRLLVMYGGLVMEEGPTSEVLSRPRHPYTASLMASLVPFGAHNSEQPLYILAGAPPNPLAPEPGCPFAPRCPLATPECRAAVPALRTEESSTFRCIEDGVKRSSVAVRDAGGSGERP